MVRLQEREVRCGWEWVRQQLSQRMEWSRWRGVRLREFRVSRVEEERGDVATSNNYHHILHVSMLMVV
jgi:hypothetical protein